MPMFTIPPIVPALADIITITIDIHGQRVEQHVEDKHTRHSGNPQYCITYTFAVRRMRPG